MKSSTTKIIVAKQVGKIGRHKDIIEELDTKKIYTVSPIMDLIRKAEIEGYCYYKVSAREIL